jgi:hypothetical protein
MCAAELLVCRWKRRIMEAAMSRTNLWSRSMSRVELDQRSREARLRLEQLERRLISHAVVRRYRLRRLLSLRRVGEYGEGPQTSRVRGPLSDRRPSHMPTMSFSRSHIAA